MSKINKLILGLAITISFWILPNVVLGASATISSGSKTIEKGKSTSVVASINSTETWNLKITSSGGSLSGTTESTDANGSETSKQVINAKFSANSVGTYTIYLTGQIAGSDLKKQQINESITITVTEPEQPKPSTPGGGTSSGGSNSGSTNKPNTTTKPSTSDNKETTKSSDSTLKSLSVLEGVISPEFNKDVREYTLIVPNEIGEINVTAVPTDSKATATVTGNVELKEGENTVTVVVTAEDGSSSKYLIRVTRARAELSLQSLVIKYKNQQGELVEVLLNPVFNFQTYEYTLEDLEYWVEKLDIEAIANIEGATIDIKGADSLVEGENTITITVKIPMQVAEGEEPQEEIKTYTIKFNKKQQPAPPTLMGRISNWFNGIFGGVGVWYNQNQEKVVLGALAVCIVALIGLSIYIIADYRKYKDVIAKLKNMNEMDKNEIQHEGIEEINTEKDKPKGGRRFLD